jgi:hypothetical protein
MLACSVNDLMFGLQVGISTEAAFCHPMITRFAVDLVLFGAS